MKKIILGLLLVGTVYADNSAYPYETTQMMNIAHKLEVKSNDYHADADGAKSMINTKQSSLTQQQAETLKSNLQKKAVQYKSLAQNTQSDLDAKAGKYHDYATNISKVSTDRLLKPLRSNSQPGHMIIFVSLGMPTESLAEITYQAYKYNIPVVIRGLYKNTYKSTVERIQDVLMKISRTHPVGGFSIDPNWFDIYQIKKVPAFVLTNNLASCSSADLSKCKVPDYDVLYGNITVQSALKEFSNRGSFSNIAEHILEKGNLYA